MATTIKEEHNRVSEKQEALITATPKAIAHLKKHLSKHPHCCGVRLSVAPSGCSGLKYVLDYVERSVESDHILNLDEDTVLYVDAKSLPFIQGVELDYVREGISERIIFRNPNEKGSCGCGESFTVKDV